MVCACGGTLQVQVVRLRPSDGSVWRRRACARCGRRVSTQETIVRDDPGPGRL